MDENKILEEIQSCLECKECMETCDTFIATQNELQSPYGRVQIAQKIFNNKKISEDERYSMYTCTLCALCNLVCVQGINITDAIHASKVKLVERNEGPYEIHNKIIKGIVDNDNSVNGIPEERLDWLPEKYRSDEIYERKDSDTLLFLGCMSSFRVKESASASYKILKMAEYDFKIFKKEPCCGEYVYSAGNLDLAKKMFQENFELFKKNGINHIIATCGGCLYAFNNVYPEYINDWDIDVKHIVQVIYELEKEGKFILNTLNKAITYHDGCRMGRKIKNMDIYNEPRELLKKCGLDVNELEVNRKYSTCCGAGSGIRGVDSSLAIRIGSKILDNLKTEEIISSCPLCVFNYRYVIYKKQIEKKSRYITDFFLESIGKE